MNLTLAIREQTNSSAIALSGHSLGAGLAFITAVVLKERFDLTMPAIAFSAPGPLTPLRSMGLVPQRSCLLQLNDEWDPVTTLTRANETGLHCPYASREPLPCTECFKVDPLQALNATSCVLCEYERHIYKHYLNLIFGDEKPLNCSKW